MFTRAFKAAGLVAAVGELKARLALRAVRRAGVTTIGYAAAAMLAVFSTLGLLGAAYIALAPHTGPAGALAIVSAAGLALAAVVWIVTMLHSGSAHEPALRAEILAEEARLASALGIVAPGAHKPGASAPEGQDDALIGGMADPKILAAALFAAAGLLGPSRLFRAIGLTTAIVRALPKGDRTGDAASRSKHNGRHAASSSRSGVS